MMAGREQAHLEDQIIAAITQGWLLQHFVGVLGIDGETGQLQPAHLFTYVLTGLIFTGRALLGEWAIPIREQAGIADLAQRFA